MRKMQYYTNSEARKVLNVSSSTLRNFVESGILKRHVPPGGKNGKYSKSEVDSLAEKRRKFFAGEQTEEMEDGIRVINSA